MHVVTADSHIYSTGWLRSFIKRNNITFGSMCGERSDVNEKVVEDWKHKLATICEGYSQNDIFNMDETGLFYRDSARKTFHFKGTIMISDMPVNSLQKI